MVFAAIVGVLLPSALHSPVGQPGRRIAIASAAAGVLRSGPSRALTSRALPFSHELTSFEVSGVTVPLGIWRPSTTPIATEDAYPYAIDIGRIAAKLRVGWLSWLPRFEYKLPLGGEEMASSPPAGFARAKEGDALLFAHGLLGSIYDLAHAAEALAADGFTVVAPELPESLSASYAAADGLDRELILAAAREFVGASGSGSGSASGPSGRWGIFGHSAGAGSALTQRGEYSLGRVLLAGGAGRMSTYPCADPLFICSSNADGCNRFLANGQPVDLRPLLAQPGADGTPALLCTHRVPLALNLSTIDAGPDPPLTMAVIQARRPPSLHASTTCTRCRRARPSAPPSSSTATTALRHYRAISPSFGARWTRLI